MLERSLFHLLRLILTSPLGLAFFQPVKWLSNRWGQEKSWVEVSHVHLKLPRLDPQFDHYKLVQISDFHIGTWLDQAHLHQAIDLVNAENPDLVAITGDFVTYRPEIFTDILAEELSRIEAVDGVVAVLGNHDHWTSPRMIRDMLCKASIYELSNSVISFQRRQACLNIAGVDDYLENADRLNRVIKNLPDDGAAILLAHEPDFADISSATNRFDLQISGHSHGGQIIFPIIGIPFLPKYSHKYPSGLYQVGSMYQYTNRGLGTAEVQVRWNCRPEITVFHLVSDQTEKKHQLDRF